eukprot:MONOS_9993.1-p1 / transcript=MONOS_9993.1 / gene=MONOS_9993 / organism=Monocercomonoides_exilis_PA203 / gene_product=unspecified product / transcript_product=unspecified product / location=Mono_scaffold00434:45737-46312(+) / protein_length=192 / sequence_SO=supercontig / SO=protein_coding / is_pseudo=false
MVVFVCIVVCVVKACRKSSRRSQYVNTDGVINANDALHGVQPVPFSEGNRNVAAPTNVEMISMPPGQKGFHMAIPQQMAMPQYAFPGASQVVASTIILPPPPPSHAIQIGNQENQVQLSQPQQQTQLPPQPQQPQLPQQLQQLPLNIPMNKMYVCSYPPMQGTNPRYYLPGPISLPQPICQIQMQNPNDSY